MYTNNNNIEHNRNMYIVCMHHCIILYKINDRFAILRGIWSMHPEGQQNLHSAI